MKYTTLILGAFFTLCLISCKKKNDNSGPTYNLSNIQEQTIKNSSTLKWEIPVELLSGSQEKVTVYLSNLPANVITEQDSVTGFPSFTAAFNLSCKYAALGTYPIYVHTKSASGTTKKYDTKLNIKTADNCAGDFIAPYLNSKSTKTGTSTSSGATATIISTTPFKIKVDCNCLRHYTLTADINCDNGTLSIPTQTPGYSTSTSSTVTGSGIRLNDGTVVLNYTYYDAYYLTTINYSDTLKQ